MDDIVINIENLSKQYEIGSIKDRGRTFREALTDKAMSPLRRIRNTFATGASDIEAEANLIWALKDISLQVKQGEVLGIIGRNGAGKTTLLKILSRITEPTEGQAIIRGRVGSLLEVGAGFHSELTGRENVYLNGAILGMKKAEINRKFDEIVAFAEVERFLDTPVKRYSTGMYMRLAFAVAANLEPDILLVDEVLAVGDAAFVKKCLGKMEEVAKGGRTVLFVSHNMGTIESLCNKGVLLESGKKDFEGEIHHVVSKYLSKCYESSDNPLSNCARVGSGKIQVISFHMESPEGRVLEVAKSGSPVVFCFEFENHECKHNERVAFSVSVHTDKEFGLFHYASHFSNIYFQDIPKRGWAKCLIPELNLAPGNFLIMCYTSVGNERADWPQVFLPITVIGADFYKTGNPNLSTWSPILVKGKWFIGSSEKVM